MIEKQLIQAVLTVAASVALAVLAACSTPAPPPGGKVETYQQEGGGAGWGGQVVVTVTTTNATVVSVNAAKRTLLLKYPGGEESTYKAGPEVAGFSRIKVGDEVKSTRVEQVALSLAKAGSLQATVTTNSTAAVTNGALPGVKTVHILNYTAIIQSIDPMGHAVTLQMADGRTKTIRVQDTVNLADFNPGDSVAIRSTEMTTVLVEAP